MKPVIVKWLGRGGLLPFVGLTAIVLTDFQGLGSASSDALRIYAALILSFLGGVHWGMAMRPVHESMFSLSMVPFFGAWAALLISGVPSYLLLIVSFVAAYLIDYFADRRGMLPPGFLKLRMELTAAVLICLMIAALRL